MFICTAPNVVSVNANYEEPIIEDIIINGNTTSNYTVSFYSKETQSELLFTVTGNQINAYDLSGVGYLGTAYVVDLDTPTEINHSSITPLRVSPDDYEKWFNWTYVTTRSVYFDNVANLTVSAIAGMIISAILGGFSTAGITTVLTLTTFAYSLGNAIKNSGYNTLTNDLYMRNNYFCTTLSEQRVESFGPNGISLGSTQDYVWMLDPYDPMSAYACKVLAERY